MLEQAAALLALSAALLRQKRCPPRLLITILPRFRPSKQVWFDSPASLEAKYALAAQLGLRGVGMWHLDCLDYRCGDAACRGETAAMWRALRAFTRPAAGGAGAQQAAGATADGVRLPAEKRHAAGHGGGLI